MSEVWVPGATGRAGRAIARGLHGAGVPLALARRLPTGEGRPGALFGTELAEAAGGQVLLDQGTRSPRHSEDGGGPRHR